MGNFMGDDGSKLKRTGAVNEMNFSLEMWKMADTHCSGGSKMEDDLLGE